MGHGRRSADAAAMTIQLAKLDELLGRDVARSRRPVNSSLAPAGTSTPWATLLE
jgi:hypothetical protein